MIKDFGKLKIQTNRGAAMMVAVILFLFGSLTVVLGVVTPAVREFNISDNLIKSRTSYAVAESGIEDIIYRVKVGKQVSSTENISLNGGSAASSVVNELSGDKTITTEGDILGRKRKIKTVLTTGVGTSFAYGVQTGNGGFTVGENATVVGNIYANGPISGAHGAVVTGSATSASSSLIQEQSNQLPTPPPSSIVFGNSLSTQDAAQGFQVITNSPPSAVSLYLKKTGSPLSATVKITKDTGGSPNSTVIASGTLVSGVVSSEYEWVNVNLNLSLTENTQLVPGQNYWIVIDAGIGSGLNYYEWAANVLYLLGDAKVGVSGGSWSNTSPSGLDGYFSLSQGNISGSIANIEIGTGSTGDARARNINASIVRGSMYCQSGVGNTNGSGAPKFCDTSQPDPGEEPMPIKDSNILEWKNDAEAGGVINGNYSIGTNMSLGPKKIVGDLSISNNVVLTITGTIWVTGKITLSNNVTLSLAPGYGSNSGVVLSDGIISLNNGVNASGSGEEGSYVMLLTTSACPALISCLGASALTLQNNAGSAILNAQNGTMLLMNNAATKEAVAYMMVLNNNADITYESGLANVNFSAGPTGSWKVKSWKEVE